MLQELYVDNYKSLVNSLYNPSSMQLLLGDNGAGKTSIFDVLEQLKGIITTGVTVANAFPTSTLTAWDQRPLQVFELQLALSVLGGTATPQSSQIWNPSRGAFWPAPNATTPVSP